MAEDIKNKCLKCEHCVKRKTLPTRIAYLHTIQSSQLLEMICMDFPSIDGKGNQNGSVLVITNDFI